MALTQEVPVTTSHQVWERKISNIAKIPWGQKPLYIQKTENFWSTTYELSVPFLSIAIENSFSSMPSWNPTF